MPIKKAAAPASYIREPVKKRGVPHYQPGAPLNQAKKLLCLQTELIAVYFNRTPNIAKKLFPSIIWNFPNDEHKVYLTFDDGPHPEITPWILAQLKQYDAKATFFCLGKNMEQSPEIILQILNAGHVVGNHGYAHLNGWETSVDAYVEDVVKTDAILKQVQDDAKQSRNTSGQDGRLFRPAYGRIKTSQISNLKSQFSIINWTLMPGDFDQSIASEKCFTNLINDVKVGDIIVLHDNEKSWKHLEYCLPRWLEFLSENNYKLEAISL